jgi:hypothetical protein
MIKVNQVCCVSKNVILIELPLLAMGVTPARYIAIAAPLQAE